MDELEYNRLTPEDRMTLLEFLRQMVPSLDVDLPERAGKVRALLGVAGYDVPARTTTGEALNVSLRAEIDQRERWERDGVPPGLERLVAEVRAPIAEGAGQFDPGPVPEEPDPTEQAAVDLAGWLRSGAEGISRGLFGQTMDGLRFYDRPEPGSFGVIRPDGLRLVVLVCEDVSDPPGPLTTPELNPDGAHAMGPVATDTPAQALFREAVNRNRRLAAERTGDVYCPTCYATATLPHAVDCRRRNDGSTP